MTTINEFIEKVIRDIESYESANPNDQLNSTGIKIMLRGYKD
jgi:hypothetical protein